MSDFITLKDYLLFPVYFIFLNWLAKVLFNKFNKDTSQFKLYKRGFYIKVLGAVAISLIYRYYYGTGDTDFYFRGGTSINKLIYTDPVSYFKIVLGLDLETMRALVDKNIYTDHAIDTSTAIIMVLCSFLGLLTFNTYLCMALFFAFISFCSSWFFYKKIIALYPHVQKTIFYVLFFMPTIVVWGAGIFKDTLTLSLLLLLTGQLLQTFAISKKLSLKGILLIIFCVIAIYNIKIYIIISFLPFALLYILQKSLERVYSYTIRNMVFLLLTIIIVQLFFTFQDDISNMLQAYALDTMKDRIKMTYEWISLTSENGAAKYDIGDMDFSSWSAIISKFPAGVNVTLYRPYPWEAGKVIIMISAIESFLILLITIYVVLKAGIFTVIKKLFTDKTLFLFFGFSILFAFMIGISTGNFGSLVRYKLPIIPFYMIILTVLNANRKSKVIPSL